MFSISKGCSAFKYCDITKSVTNIPSALNTKTERT